MLQSEEAARRLGVKVATLYAYVSRGLLESHPEPTAGGSLFDLADIERLAVREPRRPADREPVGHRDHRGHPAPTGRARLPGPRRPSSWPARCRFEEVAELLWQSDATRR